ncbi:MAG: hypothetical protein RL661_81 [Pseudomonadota bacterium]|jgi:DNA-binding response OmpR family regulator
MDTRLNIVLVEDHGALRRATTHLLQQEGHRVTALSCAEDMEDVNGTTDADLFILDLNLPGEDGLSLARRLRSAHPELGIIMLTGRDQPEDMIAGFGQGADQYLFKPIEPRTLLAAIEALTRRIKPSARTWHPITLDRASQSLSGPNIHIRLTASEINLLTALNRAPGQRLAHFQVAEFLGQLEEHYNKASLEVRLTRLRKKLIEAGAPTDCLKVIRNEGYQLCVLLEIR